VSRHFIVGITTCAVAVFVLVDEFERGREIGHAHDAQHGSEDLLTVDAHLVEQARPEEMSCLVARDARRPTVDDPSRPLLDPEIDVAARALQMLAGDERTHFDPARRKPRRLRIRAGVVQPVSCQSGHPTPGRRGRHARRRGSAIFCPPGRSAPTRPN
jgi:hypothetical protein